MKLFTPKGRDGVYICNACDREIKKMGRGSHAQMHVRKGEAIETFDHYGSSYFVSFAGLKGKTK